MNKITEPRTDESIREALVNARDKGRLDAVAAVTGIAGGVSRLEEIIRTTERLPLADRERLLIHLAMPAEFEYERRPERGLTDDYEPCDTDAKQERYE